MREFPDRCKQNFGSASEVKEEAKFLKQTKYYEVHKKHVQFL